MLDLDYRPMFWESREAAREQVARALGHVNVAVGNLDECLTAVGESEPRAAAAALRAAGAAYVFVAGRKLGLAGVDEEIGVGSDVLDVVTRTLDLLGVEPDRTDTGVKEMAS